MLDYLDVPLNDAIERNLRELLYPKDESKGYRIEPLSGKYKDKDINKITPVKIPLLSSAHWYKVLKEGRIIGYIMLFKLIKEKTPCIIITRRSKIPTEHHLIIFMLGTEEVMGLKYTLLK